MLTFPGNIVWTNISVHSCAYQDIIFYNGKFYVADVHGVVCGFDDANGPKATVIAPAPIETNDLYQKYLAESLGHLLLVSLVRKGLLFDDDDAEEDGEEEEDRDDNDEDKGDVDSNDNVDEVEDVKDSGNKEEGKES
ncbi:unnamed protein product [Fraxinus pennsylvanica]|uniref:KIB1-4 beta-propeller domain-containing protein n=1 Tax=Fraxinus pennsylvanica TaxID=56036 RepID=A0AAD1ZMP2_9LAMI|nr:unnamed protein product [Fraxinus pennsylvanica]